MWAHIAQLPASSELSIGLCECMSDVHVCLCYVFNIFIFTQRVCLIATERVCVFYRNRSYLAVGRCRSLYMHECAFWRKCISWWLLLFYWCTVSRLLNYLILILRVLVRNKGACVCERVSCRETIITVLIIDCYYY